VEERQQEKEQSIKIRYCFSYRTRNPLW